jgi:heme exporter protein D
MEATIEFLRMGGYAAFIWPAYGVATLVLVGLLWTSLRGLRHHEATLAALQETGGGRRRQARGAIPDNGGDGHDA